MALEIILLVRALHSMYIEVLVWTGLKFVGVVNIIGTLMYCMGICSIKLVDLCQGSVGEIILKVTLKSIRVLSTTISKLKTLLLFLLLLLLLLHLKSSLLREIAAEGIAKLLLSGRILSKKLLAKLLVVWFNPATEEEARLQVVMRLFFPTFAAMDRYLYPYYACVVQCIYVCIVCSMKLLNLKVLYM